MEDASSEEGCEIEEEEEEERYYYDPQVKYTSKGKVSWILNRGWGIGKKVLLTGAVISSAPFVIPPLVVTSALAFACWVPSGVVMASYTCSQKFMSKLLPYNRYEDEEEFEDAEEGVEVDLDLDREKMLMSEGIEGSTRYEYNDDELLDENALSDGMVFDVVDAGEEFSVSPIEVTSVGMEGSDEARDKVSDLLEEEETVKEARGLLEKIRDEGSIDDGMEMDNSDVSAGPRWDSMDILLDNNVIADAVDVYVSDVIEGADEIIFEEPEEKEIVNGFIEGGYLVEETRGLQAKMRDADSSDNDAVQISESYAVIIEQDEETDDQLSKTDFEEAERAVNQSSTDADIFLVIPTSTVEGGFPEGNGKCVEEIHVTDANAVSKDWASVSESKNVDDDIGVERQTGEIKSFNNIPEEEKAISEMSVDPRVVITVVEETHAPVTHKEEVPQAEINISPVKFLSSYDKENVVPMNADERKTADTGSHTVLDENNASGNVCGEESKFAELSIPRRGVSGSTDAKISSQKDNIRSNKVLENEDKIWKQIEAISSIIGYKVTSHASYMEELNALYIFTGVEPPTPFSNHTDLAQIDNRLRFLMSIIGVKDSH